MSIKGKIMIRKGGEGQEPCIVYVSHLNSFGYWSTPMLNTGVILNSTDKDLIPFNFRQFKQMYYHWQIDQCDIRKKNMIRNLKEWE